MRIEPFEIRVAEPVLEDLRGRLRHTRWPELIPGTGWSEGTDAGYLRDLVAYWERGFDWRVQEAGLNRWPHYRAEIDGQLVHFIHQRGTGPRPFPIVITHGWPGSFIEMLELIPRLTDPGRFGGDPADGFDVIVPSLPGYGFSAAPAAPGMHPGKVAELWHRLMVDGLGYRRFGAQGGDWGATVGTRLAMLDPQAVAGLHLNYLPGSYRPPLTDGARALSPAESAFLEAWARWERDEGAYGHVQRTKPQTLAFALSDSPVGLAAWIVEKLQAWSDCGGDLERRFTRDQVLAAVTLYWVTGTIGPSMRLYREAAHHPLHFRPGERVRVPCGMALFPAETPANPPREWVERVYDVVRWTEMPRGGHFAAWEEPELLAGEIREFFRERR